jgi:hypothetical protein
MHETDLFPELLPDADECLRRAHTAARRLPYSRESDKQALGREICGHLRRMLAAGRPPNAVRRGRERP